MPLCAYHAYNTPTNAIPVAMLALSPLFSRNFTSGGCVFAMCVCICAVRARICSMCVRCVSVFVPCAPCVLRLSVCVRRTRTRNTQTPNAHAHAAFVRVLPTIGIRTRVCVRHLPPFGVIEPTPSTRPKRSRQESQMLHPSSHRSHES